jgi:hypothetical protein
VFRGVLRGRNESSPTHTIPLQTMMREGVLGAVQAKSAGKGAITDGSTIYTSPQTKMATKCKNPM